MEGKKSVKPIVVMFITLFVWGMFVEQTSADEESCRLQCFMLCKYTSNPQLCRSECLTKRCIHRTTPSDLDDLHYYWKIGCASAACTNINAGEVKACVNSCSNKCTKQF
ncbi:hypothetical protein BVC80_4247g1 [Macleaya cordata]|uniref:Thionin-like protein 2 n=1 Tax=Macleaya cordata TaxID=56857 RepID=A0A200PPE9_MACCD|nr:hypothetical protein BVC80_9063g71 [Macleaya cordata]OVA00080.1 hypothetical protein BVC80_4247g1 [Macleaya cordata]